MGRERSGQPFNVQDTGRLAFRYEWEEVDERPLLIDVHGFWADETERLTYEAAVESNKIQPGEGPFSYIRRLSALVVGKYKALGQPMPRVRMSRAERDRQLAKLRAQSKGMGEGWEDYEVIV